MWYESITIWLIVFGSKFDSFTVVREKTSLQVTLTQQINFNTSNFFIKEILFNTFWRVNKDIVLSNFYKKIVAHHLRIQAYCNVTS